MRRAAEEPSLADERLILNDLTLPRGLFAARPRSRPRDGRRVIEVRQGEDYQIFVTVPADPVQARAVLSGPLERWDAEWFSNRGWVEEPPSCAAPIWRRHNLETASHLGLTPA
ncbi:hypothetical protein ABT369_25440 [Dactylosporangium sp. NPDC000244]|uniref:hypothetical protein n=1 Tax=Dactylosporangium sp. NPDC000244 TaxID=3154365 RepID=UPI00332F14D1